MYSMSMLAGKRGGGGDEDDNDDDDDDVAADLVTHRCLFPCFIPP